MRNKFKEDIAIIIEECVDIININKNYLSVLVMLEKNFGLNIKT